MDPTPWVIIKLRAPRSWVFKNGGQKHTEQEHKSTAIRPHHISIASSPSMDLIPSNKLDSTYPPSAGCFRTGTIRADFPPENSKGTEGPKVTQQHGKEGWGRVEQRAAQTEVTLGPLSGNLSPTQRAPPHSQGSLGLRLCSSSEGAKEEGEGVPGEGEGERRAEVGGEEHERCPEASSGPRQRE